jgi:hypothetical protein
VGNKNLTLKKLFENEVRAQKEKCSVWDEGVFTEEEISTLPEPVQRYFRHCNFIGKKKMHSAHLIFGDVTFKMGTERPWIKIKYNQYNFVPEPARVVHIYSRVMGIIPFEGRDKFEDGHGSMIGKLLKKITLFDTTGEEMNISAAVTFLSEVLIVPSCALQDYIKWEAIDSSNARAIIEYNGVRGEGVFTFNEKGEFLKFVTDDRYMDMGNGKSEKHRWTTEAFDYREINGIIMPTRVTGSWNLEKGDFKYFDGRLAGVEYNPS